MRAKKTCVICEELFPAFPSSSKTTCGKDCAKLRKSRASTKIIPAGRVAGTRLTVISLAETVAGRGHKYLCRCDCGEEISLLASRLRSGEVYSCGCLRVDTAKAHTVEMREKNIKEGTNIGNIKKNAKPAHNTSGVRGVSWHKQMQKWQARIQVQGKMIALGSYSDFDAAVKARRQAEEKYFKPLVDWAGD